MRVVHRIFSDPGKFRRRAVAVAAVFAVSAPVAGFMVGPVFGVLLMALAFLTVLLIVLFDACSSWKSCSCPACRYRMAQEVGVRMNPPPQESCTGLRARLFGMS